MIEEKEIAAEAESGFAGFCFFREKRRGWL